MTLIRINLDRIASATRNAKLAREVTVGPQIVAREGYVLAVRLQNDKYAYNTLEDPTGRMIRLRAGDVIAGVLGSRRALRGYAGVVPENLAPGDTVSVLNLGGVLGRCTAGNPELGPPFAAEVLGAVLTFPHLGDRVGAPAHICDGPVQTSAELGAMPPVVYIAGTCMNSGKTAAAIEIIRALTGKGWRVGACKMTGVSLMRDTLGMRDAGAVEAVDFNDAGIVATWNVDVRPVARGLLRHVAKAKPDVIVAELGDGILGEYGVDALLADRELMDAGCCHVVAAPDPVAILGAQRLYKEQFGLAIDVATGPVTDNAVGTDFIRRDLKLAAHNARYDAAALAETVYQCVLRKRAAA